ncbi:anion permease [Escherichia coli]
MVAIPCAALAVIAIIALIPVPAGLESHTWLYFAVFTGVIVGLILEPVPGAVVAMVGISIIAISLPGCFSPSSLSQALNSLQNPSRGPFPVFLIRLSG